MVWRLHIPTFSRLALGLMLFASPAFAANHLSFSASSYNFGTVIEGNSSVVLVTLKNNSFSTLSNLSVSGLGGDYDYTGGSYPGTNGTCGASLGFFGTCTIEIQFSPSTTGADNLNISATYTGGSPTAKTTLKGTGQSPALITITGAPTYNYGTYIIGQTASNTFTLKNTGQTAATNLSVTAGSAPFAFTGGSYPGTGGNCGTTLNSGASCTVKVDFTPTASGTFTATLDASYDNGVVASTDSSLAEDGTGDTAGSASFSDGGSYDFGNVTVGGNATETVTITNTGQSSMSTISITNATAPFSRTANTCGPSLAAGASCTMTFQFAPTALGTFSNPLTFKYNDGVSNQTFTDTLSGTGAQPANLTLSGSPTYNFGSIVDGSSTTATITVTNTGGGSATSVSGSIAATPNAFTFLGGSYPGTGGTCGATIAASGTCTVVLSFAPSSSGTLTNNLTVNYSDATGSHSTVLGLQGTGAGDAALAFSDAPTYTFATIGVGSTETHAFTVTNSGGTSATALGLTALSAPFSLAGGYPGTGGTCGTTLAASSSCTIVVTYAPTSGTTSSATLSLGYNNGVSAQTATCGASATAVTPASLTDSSGGSYDYGTHNVGSSTDATFTLSNGGGSTASALSGSVSAPFTFKGGGYPGTGGTCGTTLAAAGSCTIVVTFTPSAGTTFNNNLTISYNNGVTTTSHILALAGTGLMLTPANLAFSDGPTYDFGNTAQGASATHTFTVTNSGQTTAASMVLTALSAPFSSTGGTCGTTLAGGASCTVILKFSPTSAGTLTATATLSYNNGSGPASATRALQGEGLSLASLAFSSGASYNFGTQSVGNETDHTLTVTNSGQTGATSLGFTASGAAFGYKGGAFPGTNGTCSTILAAGASCTVVMKFVPTSITSFSGSLAVSYNNGSGTSGASISLSGTGVAAGQLDPAFNSNGKQTASFTSGNATGRAVAVQTDGKIIQAGYVLAGTSYRFALARFNSTGGLDATFGTSGMVTTAIGPSDDKAFAAAIDGVTGDIIVAGYSYTNATQGKDLAVAAYKTDGSLDTSFNGVGYVTIDVDSADDVINSVAIQSDGNIVIAGYTTISSDKDFLVARLTPDGAMDTPFNGDGIVAFDFGHGDDIVNALTVQTDGKIIAVGSTTTSGGGTDFGVVRFESEGAYDSGFGTQGGQTLALGSTSSSATGVAVQSDGKVVVTGSASNGSHQVFGLTRLTSAGASDTTFGSSGVTLSAVGTSDAFPTAVTLETSNEIVVAGYAGSGTSNQLALARYTTAGTLDTAFGTSGTTLTSVTAGGNDQIGGIAVQPDGKIVAGGFSTSGSTTKFAAARYTP